MKNVQCFDRRIEEYATQHQGGMAHEQCCSAQEPDDKVFNGEKWTNEELYEGLTQETMPIDMIERLVENLRGTIICRARGYLGLNGMEMADFFQEARILIWEIISRKSYNQEGGAGFATFFSVCWRDRLARMYRDFVLHNPVVVGFRIRWEGQTAIYENIESFKTSYIEQFRDKEIIRGVIWKARTEARKTLLMSPEGERLKERSVAIYLRDYSKDYRTNLRKQAKEIGMVVKTHPEWTTLKLYIDHTGREYGESTQEQLAEMLWDAGEKQFSVLVVKSRGTLSGSYSTADRIIMDLEKKGVETILADTALENMNRTVPMPVNSSFPGPTVPA